MNFWNLLIIIGLGIFFVWMARGVMFDDRYAEIFSEWFTVTATREAWARALSILVTDTILLFMVGKFSGDEYSSALWEPGVAILAVVAAHLWWWTSSGRFARQWKAWNCDTKRDTATE